MSGLTVHQQSVLTVLNRETETPINMASLIEALPQYSKQQAAMIVGSLCMKNELTVCTKTAFDGFGKQGGVQKKEGEEVTEDDVIAFLTANKEEEVLNRVFSHVLGLFSELEAEKKKEEEMAEIEKTRNTFKDVEIPEYEQPVRGTNEGRQAFKKRQHKYSKAYDAKINKILRPFKKDYEDLLREAMLSQKEPVLINEFNEYYLSAFEEGSPIYDELLKPSLFFFLKRNKKLLEDLQDSNLEKVLDYYYDEMMAGNGIEFWSNEKNTIYYGKVKFYGDREHYIKKEDVGDIIYSFNKEFAEKCLYQLVHDYRTKYELSTPEEISFMALAELLGLDGDLENLTRKELKTAFRKASMKNHPDRGGNVETMAAINEAYALLSKVVN